MATSALRAGGAVVYVRRIKLKTPAGRGRLKSVVNELDFGRCRFPAKTDARRFEPGTFNTLGIVGLASRSCLPTSAPMWRAGSGNHRLSRGPIASLNAEIVSPRGTSRSGIVAFTFRV